MAGCGRHLRQGRFWVSCMTAALMVMVLLSGCHLGPKAAPAAGPQPAPEGNKRTDHPPLPPSPPEPPPAPQPPREGSPLIIPYQEASQHVGEYAGVNGVVVQVSSSRKGHVFLNFGARYPHQTFTGFIPRPYAALFDNPQQWGGQEVVIWGKIELYSDKSEIVLKDPSQLSPAKR